MISDSDSSEQSDEVSDSDVSAEEQERPPRRGRRQPQQRPERGRGRARGRGRGRGDPPPAPAAPSAAPPASASRSYKDPDTPNQISPFTPRRPPGLHLNMPVLRGPQKFAIAEYREELVINLAGLNEYGQTPVFKSPTREPGDFVTVHIPKVTETKRNCKVCYKATQKEKKVRTYCSALQCKNVHLHCTRIKTVLRFGTARTINMINSPAVTDQNCSN